MADKSHDLIRKVDVGGAVIGAIKKVQRDCAVLAVGIEGLEELVRIGGESLNEVKILREKKQSETSARGLAGEEIGKLLASADLIILEVVMRHVDRVVDDHIQRSDFRGLLYVDVSIRRQLRKLWSNEPRRRSEVKRLEGFEEFVALVEAEADPTKALRERFGVR